VKRQVEQFTLVKALFTDIETNAYTSGYIVFTKLGVLEPKLEKLQA
jgi:hypothetical protein